MLGYNIRDNMRLVLTFTLFILTNLPLYAKEQNPSATFNIRPMTKATNSSQPIVIGLNIKIPLGWKIFWRSPGEIGYPTKIMLTGSSNIKHATILWPQPQRKYVSGLQINVYTDEIMIPIQLTAKNSLKPINIKLNIDYSLCSIESCIPKNKTLSLQLAIGKSDKTRWYQTINNAMNKNSIIKLPSSSIIVNSHIKKSNQNEVVFLIRLMKKKEIKSKNLFLEGHEKISFKSVKKYETDHHIDYEILAFNNGLSEGIKLKDVLLAVPVKITLIGKNNLFETTLNLQE